MRDGFIIFALRLLYFIPHELDTSMTDPKTYTVRSAARELGLANANIQYAIAKKLFKPSDRLPSGQWVITEADLQRLRDYFAMKPSERWAAAARG